MCDFAIWSATGVYKIERVLLMKAQGEREHLKHTFTHSGAQCK